MTKSWLIVGGLLSACAYEDSSQYDFAPIARRPAPISGPEVAARAQSGLRPGEITTSIATFAAHGVGQTVVQVVAETPDDARAYVVDEDGNIEPTESFWRRERNARVAHFGRMTPELFSRQAAMDPTEVIDVEILLRADLPEPMLPEDGTDKIVSISRFEQWTTDHARAQQLRLADYKQRVRGVLANAGVEIHEDPSGLPVISAAVPVGLLRGLELNAADVVRIDSSPTGPARLLGDHAGHAAMNSTSLSGGSCVGVCDGGNLDVGIWEVDNDVTIRSGLARQSSRFSTSNFVTGYYECIDNCNTDADCAGTSDVIRSCRHQSTYVQYGDHAGVTCLQITNLCVQDHLSWVASSVGMVGAYNYLTTYPAGSDPIPNVPAGTSLPSGGAWKVDYRVGNNTSALGLSYLVSPTDGAPPAVYVNRSQDQTPDVTNWAPRAYGTFVAAAAGNSESGNVTCGHLRNGLCVGMYDYRTFNDPPSHRRTALVNDVGSSWRNDPFDTSLERPHVLGPGNHDDSTSGEHMPRIDVNTGYDMTYGLSPILGTSFAAPAVVSAAIMAHQYEGFFSWLAFPMVNKAVLMAGTQDANADGAIGKSNFAWSGQPSDAEDGAGQINLAHVKTTLDNNRYYWNDLTDGNFVSCGTNCREFFVTSFTVNANVTTRVALAWQACMENEGSLPVLNNDLDLVLSCGSPIQLCGGSLSSTSVTSELEMVERPGCSIVSAV